MSKVPQPLPDSQVPVTQPATPPDGVNAGRVAPPEGSRPWYSTHTRTSRGNRTTFVKLYPDAVEVRNKARARGKMRGGGGGKRGKVTGLSKGSAARLRKACMTLNVPGSSVTSWSLTVHREISIEDYKRVFHVFRQKVARMGVAGIFRHEMQRRGTPHAHLLVWTDPEKTSTLVRSIRDCWFDCTGEGDDFDALRRSVVWRTVDNQDRWAVYMALHHGKKGAQSDYPGKAWGYLNRKLLVERGHTEVALTASENVLYRRRIKHWLEADRRDQRERCRIQGRKPPRKRVRMGHQHHKLLRGLGTGVPEKLLRGLGTVKEPSLTLDDARTRAREIRAERRASEIRAEIRVGEWDW